MYDVYRVYAYRLYLYHQTPRSAQDIFLAGLEMFCAPTAPCASSCTTKAPPTGPSTSCSPSSSTAHPLSTMPHDNPHDCSRSSCHEALCPMRSCLGSTAKKPWPSKWATRSSATSCQRRNRKPPFCLRPTMCENGVHNTHTFHKTPRPRTNRLRVCKLADGTFLIHHTTATAQNHAPATQNNHNMPRRKTRSGLSIGSGRIYIRRYTYFSIYIYSRGLGTGGYCHCESEPGCEAAGGTWKTWSCDEELKTYAARCLHVDGHIS